MVCQLKYWITTYLIVLFHIAAFGQATRPNIIFILTDDHRWDALGYAGNKIIQTPQLDQLAANGVFFKNAYVTTSICCVSRASILSGQYASRHQINDFTTEMGVEALETTYPFLLRKSGYYTGFIGKYGVGREMPDSLFDKWYGFPGQGSYYQTDNNGNSIHLTKLIGNQAEEFLESSAKEQPFCLSISFKAPHTEGVNEFVPDTIDSNLYSLDSIPASVTAADHYFEAFPDSFKKNNEARSRWFARFSTPELFQENVKKYYRLISGVDRVVGRIQDKLSALHLDQNTIIIFTSDNGFYLGEHGLAGKWYGHEESIRVPLIIYDPRVPNNKRGDIKSEIALNIDIAPTILALADLTVPQSMQGRDLTYLIETQRPVWRTDFFYEHTFSYNNRIPRSEGVVNRQYKYLRYLDFDHEELYDNMADPHETKNLALRVEYRDLLKRMRNRYYRIKEKVK